MALRRELSAKEVSTTIVLENLGRAAPFPYSFLEFSTNVAMHSETTADYVLAVVHAVWHHASIGQLSQLPQYVHLNCLCPNVSYILPLWNLIYHFDGFDTNQHKDQLSLGLLAQLVDHCTGIAEVMSSNPVRGWIFFKPYFHYYIILLLRGSLSHISPISVRVFPLISILRTYWPTYWPAETFFFSYKAWFQIPTVTHL